MPLAERLRANAWAIAAFVWGVAEGTLFFIVPDVLLSFVGLRRGVRAGLVASLAGAFGAAVGGALLYAWSTSDPAGAERAVLGVPAISDAMALAARQAMETEGWFLAALEGPLTSTPYKVYALFAPQLGVGLVPFVLGSVVARLPRFVLSSSAAALARIWLGARGSEKQLTWVLGAFWLVFYAIFFAVTPS